jgi:enoyl-CoA hydratase/3-hydroxyacyl-CoA dehydrogenase
MIANVRGLVTRKKLTQQKAEGALSLLKGVLDYAEFKDVDMVIEVSFPNFFFFF